MEYLEHNNVDSALWAIGLRDIEHVYVGVDTSFMICDSRLLEAS